MFWQCGISARKNGGVSKKKRSLPFRRRLFPSKEEAITFFLRTPSLLRLVNPFVVFISKWQSFKKCSRAAQNALEGRMRPAGRSLPTPGLEYVTTFDCRIYFLYFLRSTDRRNALENFFRRYKQDALDETFLSIF